jgi:hypothetical protein
MKDDARSVLIKALQKAQDTKKEKSLKLRDLYQQKRKVEDEYVDSAKRVSRFTEALRKLEE